MTIRSVLPAFAVLAVAPVAVAQAPLREDDEIVVTAERPRGSVPGDVTPESTFSREDVRAYGATSIFQVLAALAPQTGSASIRGRGGLPIVLVNGRRISGFQEIRDLPPEAISRVEVFDEQLSLQYGYSADQRVVNIVLELAYTARSAEAGGGMAAGDARATARAEGRFVEIEEGDRIAAGVSHDTASKVTERERGIAPPAAGADARDARTLAPAVDATRANIALSRALDERVTGNASLRYEATDVAALLGLDASGGLRLRDTETDSVRATLGLDGAAGGWQWTATATADASRETAKTADSLAPSRTRADQTLYDITANANGAVADLPGGRLRAAFRASVEERRIESRATDSLGDRRTELERTTPSARATLIAPVTSRRNEFGAQFGDISLNATASWSAPSDFDSLSSFGAGGSWSPVPPLRFSVQAERSEAAPGLQQLGAPPLTTPDAPFFDPVLGRDARVALVTGGNAALRAESREDVTVNASWSPPAVRGLTLQASWAQNDSEDAVIGFPTQLPEAFLAFPTRFSRDASGALTGVDVRPINIASRNIESLRWGMSFSGAPGRRGAAGQRPPGPPAARPPGAGAAGAPGLPAGLSPGGAMGRWSFSVYHRVRLSDDLVLTPGAAPIDLLERGGLTGGETASAIEFEGGVMNRGIGLRFNGGWTDAYKTPLASGDALSFSDRWTVNARLFVNIDSRPRLRDAAPLLRGGRLFLSVDNLTDSFVEVRDASGATPVAYQEGYQNPLGRVVQLGFQKQF